MTLKKASLQNIKVNCIALAMYCGSAVTLIFATYLLWNYCNFLVKDPTKLELVINQVVTFIFGGSVGGGGIFLLTRDK